MEKIMRSTSGNDNTTHVAIFSSAGMGHLTPCLRLAALLLRRCRSQCRFTLVTSHPTVSLAESNLISRFLSDFPEVSHLQLNLLLPSDSDGVPSAATDDPFWLQFDAIRRSSHLISPLLASVSPPLSALVLDVSLITPVVSVAEALSLPSYVFFPSCARMLSLLAYFPFVASHLAELDAVQIPGIPCPIPTSSLPPPLLNPDSLFTSIFLTDAPKLAGLNGVLINTFGALEAETLHSLSTGKVVDGFPPLFTLGPFPPCEFEKEVEHSTASGSDSVSKWLDGKPDGSVVFVSFGGRTALPRERIKAVGEGLARSGSPFLWVVKDKIVDKDDKEGLDEIMGLDPVEKMEEKGLVVKHWVEQGEILGHRAVGGFFSHSGWNSVVEAAWHGVRMLAWPPGGDQKVIAEVVRESGLGVWPESWGWAGDRATEVTWEEIGERVREMMESEALKSRAARIGVAAREAAAAGGSRHVAFDKLINEWIKKRSGSC